MNTLVSAIIPAFNSEKWIDQAINSLINQNIDNIEIIVVNDGSTDSTPEIVSNYGSLVKLINQENSGVSWARRTGVRHASGKYIKFLDSDDRIPNGGLRAMLDVAEKYPGDSILGKSVAVDASGMIVNDNMYSLPYRPNHLDLIHPEAILTQATSSGLWLLPKKYIDYDGFYDKKIKLGEEYSFCIELIKRNKNIRFCDSIVYHARAHDSSARLSRSTDEGDHMAQINQIYKSVNFIKSELNGGSIDSIGFIAQLCWSRGRECVRIGCNRAAAAYFQLAIDLNPRVVPVGNSIYQIISRTVGPVRAENLISYAKDFLRRRSL